MINSLELAEHLKNNINWQRFVNLAHSVGNQLNDEQWRFFKAVVFENSMEAYSDGSVKYVGQEGCDLLVTMNGTVARVEMKYTEHALYSPKGKTPREFSQPITLMNSKGTNVHQELPQHWADFLLVVGIRAAAIIDRQTLNQFVKINGDSITTRIPTDKMIFVFTPETSNQFQVFNINLRDQINQAVKEAIAKVL